MSQTRANPALVLQIHRAKTQHKGSACPPSPIRLITTTRLLTWTRAIPWTALQSKRQKPRASRAPSQRNQRAQPRDPLAPEALVSQTRACGRGGQPWRARTRLFLARPLLLPFPSKCLESPPVPGAKPSLLPGPVEGIRPPPPPSPRRSRRPSHRTLCPLPLRRSRSWLLPSLTPLPPHRPEKPPALQPEAPSPQGRAGLRSTA